MASFFNMKGITGNEFQIGIKGPIITRDTTNSLLTFPLSRIEKLYLGSTYDSSKYINASNYTGKAATAGIADKISDLTEADLASNSATKRYVFMSYLDGTTGRPAYDPDFLYQTSTDTLFVKNLSITGLTASGTITGNLSGNVTGNLTGDVTGNVSGNAGTATKLANTRTITIGGEGKTFDGSSDISFTLANIGAASSSHNHNVANLEGWADFRTASVTSGSTAPITSGGVYTALQSYLPLAGGNLTGGINIGGTNAKLDLRGKSGSIDTFIIKANSTNTSTRSIYIQPDETAGSATTTGALIVGGSVESTPDLTYKLKVVGKFNATNIYENGSALSALYLGIGDTAANATKLNNQAASYYLNYNNFTNKPTLGTAAAKDVVTAGTDVTATNDAKIPTVAAVRNFVDAKVSGVYQFKGTIASVTTNSTTGLITPPDGTTAGNGFIYNVQSSFTYLGETYPAGTNIVCEVDTNATSGTNSTLWKPLGGMFDVDLSAYQPKDADLTAIAGISDTAGFLKKTAANTWSLDNSTYVKASTELASNETMYLAGVKSGALGQLKHRTSITASNGVIYADLNGSVTGNASSADKWKTARTISLTGSVTGSVSLDGSGDVSIATTTAHTHNYAGSNSAGGTANSSYYLYSPGGRLTSANITDNAATSKIRFDLASSSMTTGKPANDGWITTYFWDSSNTYDTQFWIPAVSTYNDGRPQLRFHDNKTDWTSWKSLAYYDDISSVLGNWTGSSKITTVGTISSGTWAGTAIASGNIASTLDSKTITNSTYNGYTLAAACAKAVVTSIDTSASLPTSNAVKTFVEGKGYAAGSHTHSSLVASGSTSTVELHSSTNYAWQVHSHVNSSTTGLFATSNNANAILTINKHEGNYDSQLGFSANGNIYYRNFNGAATDSTTAWKTLAYIDSTVSKASKLAESRTLTIGSSGKTFDGSADVSWTLSEIGAATSGHSHAFSELTGWSSFSTSSATQNSTAPITSGGVYTKLLDYQPLIDTNHKLAASLISGTMTSGQLPSDVVYTTATQALTNKTYNGLTISTSSAQTMTVGTTISFANQTNGFSMSGGTTSSKTLTVPASYTLGSACAASIITAKNATASDTAVMSEKLAINSFQAADSNLTAIAGKGPGSTTGFLKKTAANTWSIDTNSYDTTSHTHGQISHAGIIADEVTTTNNYNTSALVLAYGASSTTSGGNKTAGTVIKSSLKFDSTKTWDYVLCQNGQFQSIQSQIQSLIDTSASDSKKYAGNQSSTSKLYVLGVTSTSSTNGSVAPTNTDALTWVDEGTVHGAGTFVSETAAQTPKVQLATFSGTAGNKTATTKATMQYNTTEDCIEFVFA